MSLSSQARFRSDACAAGITLSADRTTATKTGSNGWGTNVLLTRPSVVDSSITVSWRYLANGNSGNTWRSCIGWAVPNLNVTMAGAYSPGNGSFVIAGGTGGQTGDGATGNTLGALSIGDVVSLRYLPSQGQIHGRKNGNAEVLLFSGLADNLVPAVLITDSSESFIVVD